MAGLKAIKQKIRSTDKTRKVTKAMEAVSAAKMRKAQQKAIAGRAYAKAAVSILSRVSGSKELQSHPLVKTNDSKKILYIVLTSDKGLAGALNSAVLRQIAGEIKENDLFISIGRKSNEFLLARGYQILGYHPNTDTITSEMIQRLIDEASKQFLAGHVREVRVVYQNFISTFEQRPTMRTVFPLSLEELKKVVSDIVPAKGAFSRPHEEENPSIYTIEPSDSEVMSAILPRLAGIFLYHALLESQASEHSARMVSMKSASDKAGEMRHSLTLKFNKARQAAITREVSEITGGMEAMLA